MKNSQDSNSRERREFNAALKKVENALSSGQRKLIKQKAEGRVSIATLYNWINDPNKAFGAYKADIVKDIANLIPDKSAKKRDIAYENLLGELKVEPETQIQTMNYKGIYNVFHNFENIEMEKILIQSEKSPICVYFWLRYFCNLRVGHCDGLVYSRNGNLVLSGISNSCCIHGVFREVVDPSKNYIFGFMNILDFNNGHNLSGKIALVNQSLKIGESEKQKILNFI